MDVDLPLLEAIRAGDEAALEDLMQRHQEALYFFVLRYVGSEPTARDIVQETFVRAYFKAGAFQPRSTVKTWIYTIALNLCRDSGRRRARTPAFVSLDKPTGDGDAAFELPDRTATADEAVAEGEQIQELRQAVDRLPEKLKAPLIFCVLEGRSHKEAAELLGATPKSIELRIYRAKRKLRDGLTRKFPEWTR